MARSLDLQLEGLGLAAPMDARVRPEHDNLKGRTRCAPAAFPLTQLRLGVICDLAKPAQPSPTRGEGLSVRRQLVSLSPLWEREGEGA